MAAKKLKDQIEELNKKIALLESGAKQNEAVETKAPLMYDEDVIYGIKKPMTTIPEPPKPKPIEQDENKNFRQIALRLCNSCFKVVHISEDCECGAPKGYKSMFIKSE